jgi:NAD(P) transhydrogenase subunit alpha
VRIICFIALVFGTLNVIGGFLVTDRMLGMFKGKKVPKNNDALPAGKSDDTAKELTK